MTFLSCEQKLCSNLTSFHIFALYPRYFSILYYTFLLHTSQRKSMRLSSPGSKIQATNNNSHNTTMVEQRQNMASQILFIWQVSAAWCHVCWKSFSSFTRHTLVVVNISKFMLFVNLSCIFLILTFPMHSIIDNI